MSYYDMQFAGMFWSLIWWVVIGTLAAYGLAALGMFLYDKWVERKSRRFIDRMTK